jgi:hypothetical protein
MGLRRRNETRAVIIRKDEMVMNVKIGSGHETNIYGFKMGFSEYECVRNRNKKTLDVQHREKGDSRDEVEIFCGN